MGFLQAVSVFAISVLCTTDPFVLLSRVDDFNVGHDAQVSAVAQVASAADSNSLLCVELARRMGAGVPMLVGPICDVFEDPEETCSRELVNVIEVLRATDDDIDLHYALLSKEQLRSRPDFVERTLLRYPKGSQSAVIAALVARFGLAEFAEQVATNVLNTKFHPTELIEARSFDGEIAADYTNFWQDTYGPILIELRSEGNHEVVDSALRKIRDSLVKRRRIQEGNGKRLGRDHEELMEKISRALED